MATRAAAGAGAGGGVRALSARRAVAVIGWLEWRTFANFVSKLRRHRGRAAAWSVFLVLAVIAVVARSSSPPAPPSPLAGVVLALAALAPEGFWLATGLLAWSAASSAPVSFPRSADARMLPASGLSPRLVVAWLALRQMLLAWARMAPAMLWVLVYSSSGGATGLGFGLVGLFAMRVTLHPLRLLAWRAGRRHAVVVKGIAAGVVAWSVATMAASVRPSLGAPHPLDVLRAHVLALPPGSWWAHALGGNALDLGALAGLALVAVAATVALSGDDMYPDIWAASQLGFRLRELRAGRGALSLTDLRRATRQARYESRALRQDLSATPGEAPAPARGLAAPRARRHAPGPAAAVPTGAWALAWKEWLETTRRIGLAGVVASVLVAAAIGSVAGVVARSSARPGATLVALGALSIYLMVLGNVVAAQRIAADLGRPLWWMSSASLLRRLAVATAASAARQAALVGPAAAAAVVVAGFGWVAVGLVPLVGTLAWLFRSTSIAVMSLLPSSPDLRGPGMLLRLLTNLVSLATLGVAGGVSFALTHDLAAAAAVAAVLAAGEGAGALAFASRRLQGNGFAVAAATSRAR